MIERVATSLLRRPVAVSMAYAALVTGGLFALGRLPLDLAPSVEFPALSVHTTWHGISAETVEMILTAPIEEIANTIDGVRAVRSTSSEGASEVGIEFEHTTKMDFARLELREKLAALVRALPPGIGQPAIEPYVPEDFRNLQGFMSYSLVGNRPASTLRKLAREEIASGLRALRGVADATVYGGEEEEVRIELDAERVVALGLNLEDVKAGLAALEYNAPVGGIVSGARRHVVSVRNMGLTLSELERTAVSRTANGTPVRVGEIGTIRLATGEPKALFRINGKPSVTLAIDKDPSANMLRLADAVASRVEELRRTLPEGIDLILESDRSQDLREELHTLYRDIVLSLLCIFVVLFLFLGHLKAPVLVLSSICFSLAGTFLAFWMLGIGLHLLSLAGLVLGFGRLVDDSIVVLDNIQRRTAGTSAPAEISAAAGEIALPVVASTLTTIGALLPTAFLPEGLKAYFVEFSLAVGISLLMSLLVSFTLIPVVAGTTQLKPLLPAAYARAADAGTRAYTWLLRKALAHKAVVVILVVWLFGLPVWLLPGRIEGSGFLASAYNAVFGSTWYRAVRPYVNTILGGTSHLFFAGVSKGEVWEYGRETYLVVRVVFPQGTDLERYDEIARRVESEALTFSAYVEKVICRVEPRYAFVRITIADSVAGSAIPFIIKSHLTALAARTGGASITVWGFGPGYSSGGESPPSFAVRVLGYNYYRVRELAERLRERLQANPRITDVEIDRSWSGQWGKATELVATVDRTEAARHNLTVAEVLQAVRTYTPGVLQSNNLTIGGERFPCTVKFAGYQDRNVDNLQEAMLTGSDGRTVRLASVLTLREQRTSAEILRENQSYVRWVTFEYRGPYRYGNAFVDATIRSMSLPHGYRIDKPGAWFTFSEGVQRSMLLVAGWALVIVFMITASLYESFKKPFLVILAVPFSLIGLFLAFSLTGTPFGQGGYAAVILLTGIVVTNSVVLVDFLSRQSEKHGAVTEVLVAAAGQRLRPVLMTTLTTIGGLLPMFLLGKPSSLWYSLALGTIGGLMSSMVLTLIVVPVVFSLNLRPSLRTMIL
jgi:multidrug efflux pump subunit AcrB